MKKTFVIILVALLGLSMLTFLVPTVLMRTIASDATTRDPGIITNVRTIPANPVQ
ncbi:MAG: hypothetical protein WDN10_05525 [bacterium]